MNSGIVVKEIRNHLNISQEQLARDLEISFSTISRWENGRTLPSKLAKLRLIDYCKAKNIDDEIVHRLMED